MIVTNMYADSSVISGLNSVNKIYVQDGFALKFEKVILELAISIRLTAR
jgi:hypothetical protein